MLRQISAVLHRLCDQNAPGGSNDASSCDASSSDLSSSGATVFDSKESGTRLTLPSLHCYLVRMYTHTEFDSLCFLVALAYLQRLAAPHTEQHNAPHTEPHTAPHTEQHTAQHSNAQHSHAQHSHAQHIGNGSHSHARSTHLHARHGPSLRLRPTHRNVHRLFVTALLVASKASDDVFHPNQFMAKCGGISNAELNLLEVDLCVRLRWGLAVEPEELIALTRQLDQLSDASPATWTHGGEQACKRSCGSPEIV